MWYYAVISQNYALSHILCVLCEIMQSHKIIITAPYSLLNHLISGKPFMTVSKKYVYEMTVGETIVGKMIIGKTILSVK